MDDCIFCKVISGELPSLRVYEDDDVLAFVDINPVNIGHIQIIPKKHFEAIYDTPDDLTAKIAIKVRELAIAVKKATNADGINIISNNDRAAGQIIYHYHVHIIPRFEGDGHKQWSSKVFSEGERKEMGNRIKEQVALLEQQ